MKSSRSASLGRALGAACLLALAAAMSLGCEGQIVAPGGKMPTPYIQPAGGAVSAGTAVTILCADMNALIRYTQGGADVAAPTATTGTPYDADHRPTVDSACTIKAMAYKEGCVDSDPATASFTLAVDPVEPADFVPVALPDLALALGAAEAAYFNMGDIWGMDPGYATSIGVESGLDGAGQRVSRFSLAGYGCGFIALKYSGLTPGATVSLSFDADVDLSGGVDADPEGFHVFAGEASDALPADGFGLGAAKRYWSQDGAGEGASTGGWRHYEDLSACASASGEYLVCLRLNDWALTSTRAFSGALRALSVAEAPEGQAPVKRLPFPSLSPSGGWIDRPAEVTIALSKPLADAVIRYTLDGSAPTEASQAYEGPIALGLGTTTISAATFREGEEASALSRATYRRADRPAGELVANGGFDSGLDFWQYGNKPASTPPVDYSIAVEGGAAHFTVASPGSEAWHIMLRYWASQGVTLEQGHRYALSFRAKSDRDRAIKAIFEEDNRDLNGDGSAYSRYNGVGGADTAYLGSAWRGFRIEFAMNNPDDGRAKFDFQLGDAMGDVWIDDIGLADVTASADAGTIGVTVSETLLPDGFFSMFRSPLPSLWIAVDIADAYYREIAWTDEGSGAYPGETDVLVSFYQADRATPVKNETGVDIEGVDSGPVPLNQLSPGRYYIKIQEKTAGGGVDCRVAMRVRS